MKSTRELLSQFKKSGEEIVETNLVNLITAAGLGFDTWLLQNLINLIQVDNACNKLRQMDLAMARAIGNNDCVNNAWEPSSIKLGLSVGVAAFCLFKFATRNKSESKSEFKPSRSN